MGKEWIAKLVNNKAEKLERGKRAHELTQRADRVSNRVFDDLAREVKEDVSQFDSEIEFVRPSVGNTFTVRYNHTPRIVLEVTLAEDARITYLREVQNGHSSAAKVSQGSILIKAALEQHEYSFVTDGEEYHAIGDVSKALLEPVFKLIE